jgi:hypothetical protein
MRPMRLTKLLISRARRRFAGIAHQRKCPSIGDGLRGMRPARKASRPASTALLHRAGHQHRVLRAGDGGVHQHAVAAELHRDRRVGRGAHAGVDDDRHRALSMISRRFHGFRMPMPEPIGWPAASPPRSRSLPAAWPDRVVAGVDHHVEAVAHQRFGGDQRLRHVREQRLRVAQHFELDQLWPSSSSRARRSVRTASSAV